jgi:hypothetical protein
MPSRPMLFWRGYECVVLAFIIGIDGLRAANAPRWEPSKTFVLVASVIEWPTKAGLPGFTDEKRLDVDLVAQFRNRGVPVGNIVFLKDEAATHPAICKALATISARAGPGSTLVFYFQGHGGRQSFCCYDFDAKNAETSALHVDEIFSILTNSWRGDRLVLLGDCCNSGSLASIVHRYNKERPGARVAMFASATASNISTGRWTFAASLIRILGGDPRADFNHDGEITVDEAGHFVHDRMKFEENQLSGYALTSSFEKNFVIQKARETRPPRIPGSLHIGDVIDAQDQEGKWYASEIINWQAPNKYRVHFYGWDSKWDEWIPPSRMRPLVKPKLEIGKQYDVQWEDENWYLGTITRALENWFYFVHYESEAGEDDEWITADRTRPVGNATRKSRPQFRAVTNRPLQIGDKVAAQWFRDWYRGRIVGSKNGTFAIVYDDGSKSSLAADDLIPIAHAGEIHVGDSVLACWDDKGRMFPGRIQSMNGAKVTVRWDDGDTPSEVGLDEAAVVKRGQ